ncbi:apolipoprotein N-acyltransferase [Corynebacterium macginleyi]|uniref:apolipoprotein N-acyltransferase n=1 Tax=Corynebacterium macginleyi TaxID=38290 RepID=UPI00190BA369|nr:apolipoprotein N-acyltransferase [Corynebacterium macginleyi]
MQVFLARLTVAALSGALTFTAVEPHGCWWGAIIGIALLYMTLMPWRGRQVRGAAGAFLAVAHGLVLYLLSLPWIGELVGIIPYTALSIWLSVYAIALGIFGAAVARWRFGFLVFPLVYLAVEVVRSSVPFGGFPWVKLAWGQIEGPLASLAPWGGTSLITVATVLSACGLAGLLLRGGKVKVAAGAAFILPLMAGLAAGRGIDPTDTKVGEAKVAAIQGNVPRSGLDFAGQRRAVLNNHIQETEELAKHEDDIDLVIWPENSSDIDPFRDSAAAQAISGAVDAIDAPVLVGTATRDEVGARNTMQVFTPGHGVGEHHHKKYLQPFGETMPMRDFFARFSDYVDLAGDFKAGDGTGVVSMNSVAVGVATCYEVSFDDAFRKSIQNGAQILTTPTNNATFGFSDMTYQQLAMSRLRALETDRAVVVAATSGVSALVHPNGSISQSTKLFEPAALVESLPLKTGETFSVRYGSLMQWLMVIIGTVCALIAVRTNRLGRTPRGVGAKEK